MRTEQEVLAQLLAFAQDEHVRAVLLNGSRVNPNAVHDIFCDYDVIFAVTDPHYFWADQSWIARFGDLIIAQKLNLAEDGLDGYICMMIFSDGVRIDLSFRPADKPADLLADSLTVVLLDKDNLIGPVPPPSDAGYCVRRPTAAQFDSVTNEFWWCATYVAKGLWRDELSYARYMYDAVVKDCLLKMLAWHIGQKNNWQVNPGKYGKWFKKFLPADLWQSFEKTYAGADEAALWNALFTAGSLFRLVGLETAAALGYRYPLEDNERVTAYLQKIQALPKDTQTF